MGLARHSKEFEIYTTAKEDQFFQGSNKQNLILEMQEYGRQTRKE